MNVIVLADAALETNNRPEMEAVIRQLEERHGHQLDAMTSLLRKSYKDPFLESPTAETKRIAQVLRRPGSDYRRIFLNAAMKAEGEALRMVDFYLPRAKRIDIEQLAEEMKTDETRDIVSIRKRLPTGDQFQ